MAQYLVRVGEGDRAAFADLYELTVGRMFRQIQSVLIDNSQAEEVTQEVFLEIWQSARRFRVDRGGALPWMLTIARRRAIDRVRASQASRDRDHRIGTRDIGHDYDHDWMMDRMEVRRESARARLAMNDLSELQRQAVQLSYFDELTLPEISARLQVPVGTVKNRIREGVLRLRINMRLTSR